MSNIIIHLFILDLITLICVALVVSSIHARETTRLRGRSHRDWPNGHKSRLEYNQDYYDNYDDYQQYNDDYYSREGPEAGYNLDSIDAFNPSICGKANYADDWMKTLNSYECKSKSTSSRWGDRKAKNRIAGGYFPKLGDFPSTVHLIYRNSSYLWHCGGVIIHNDLILTAAHCLQDRSKFPDAYIIAGTLSATNVDNKGVKINLAGQCASVRFDLKQSGLLFDWAVLKLAQPLTYSASIQPACIDLWRTQSMNSACVTAGFGRENLTHPTERLRASIMSPLRPELQPERLPLSDELSFYFGTTLYENIRDHPSSANVCVGDSGSPMYCFDNCSPGETKMYAVAVASAVNAPNISCTANAVEPSVWTDLNKQAIMGLHRDLESCLLNLTATVNSPRSTTGGWRRRRNQAI